MCAVSVISDYGRGAFPQWHQPFWQQQTFPNPLTVKERKELEALRAFKKLHDAAKEFDKKAKQPECEDPEKAKILKSLEKRLAKLEKAPRIGPREAK